MNQFPEFRRSVFWEYFLALNYLKSEIEAISFRTELLGSYLSIGPF